ncbi:MAG: hypothetical protein HKO53_12180 [Gemmatimonadetes bacterium]|nr:hypothetical protein [Gemmatimonadota bacterium]
MVLGGVVHPAEDAELAEMDSSLLMMDIIVTLMLAFPGQLFYLSGNHDTFSTDTTKRGVGVRVHAVRRHQGFPDVSCPPHFWGDARARWTDLHSSPDAG